MYTCFGIVGVLVLLFVALSVWIAWREADEARRRAEIEDTGEPVVAWMLMVNTVMYVPPEESKTKSAAACVIVPTDPNDGYRADYMQRLVRKLSKLNGRRSKPRHGEEAIQKAVWNQFHRAGRWHPLPEDWLDGEPVYYTTMMVYREHLDSGVVTYPFFGG